MNEYRVSQSLLGQYENKQRLLIQPVCEVVSQSLGIFFMASFSYNGQNSKRLYRLKLRHYGYIFLGTNHIHSTIQF